MQLFIEKNFLEKVNIECQQTYNSTVFENYVRSHYLSTLHTLTEKLRTAGSLIINEQSA